ncbi:helix-turn-helix domain-containing protein [Actinoplanes sp. TRM 88003]|uniref:Helix-turn-helix domain-containing protein n=1 Tax=Paractinoplanes aksuensis TaxID=2939490 RepID=A0ABT1DT65_9ACTN|nr:helix-turn-helix domain-containing protein [Actinoplanes aksuensis]MCO8274032.1 helix-turn-helix domain-containing protein [Actinoplanes aksuensis]
MGSVSAPERFADYRQRMAHLPVAVDVSGDPAENFQSDVRTVVLDPEVELSVNAIRGCRMIARRTPAMVRRSDPEAYRFLVVLHGRADATHCGRGGRFETSDMGLYDTSQPFEVARAAQTLPAAFAMITFAPGRLAVPRRTAADLMGARLDGRRGVGAVVADFVRRLATESQDCTPADRTRLARSALDLIGVALAHEIDHEPPRTTEAWRRSMVTRAQHFIESHLGDPALDPATVAAAHHISVRLLHKLFEEAGISVADWIRTRRLERCRDDLSDPLQQTRPVRLIAAQWGFRSDAHFNRAFRTAYGQPPGEWRSTRP